MASAIAQSKEYASFRNSVARKTIIVDHGRREYREWFIYEHGPKDSPCPIIFLPPASGTADVYFYQMLTLGAQGYRTISVEFAPYFSHSKFCEGMAKFLEQQKIPRAHFFGASLGGFLAQKFAEQNEGNGRVVSLFLCNSFVDTASFKDMPYTGLHFFLPAFMLRRIVMSNFPEHDVEARIADSIDFMVERLELLQQPVLASRLALNCEEGYIAPQTLANVPITVMDVFDECAIAPKVRDEVLKCFPHSKQAHLKCGGNFPYLSRADEVSMHLKVHMRQFEDAGFDGAGPSTSPAEEDSFVGGADAGVRPTAADKGKRRQSGVER
eukprot:Opistho-2@14439